MVWQGSAGDRRPYADQVGQGLPTPSAYDIPCRGGRRWWALLARIRINIAPTILKKEIEDFFNVAVFSLLAEEFERRPSPIGFPRSLDVAADVSALPDSPMPPSSSREVAGMGHEIDV